MLKKRWIYVFCGFMVFLFLGAALAWSVFVVPIETLYGWTRSQTSLAFTINVLCFSVGSILAGILSKHMTHSTLLKVAAVVMLIGFFGASLITQPWHLYVTYGFIVGTAIGMGYNCVLSTVPSWLPDKSGTVTGMLLMGYSLSTAIFGPVLNSLISSVGIVNTFRILGIICCVGIFLGSILIRKPTVQEMEKLPKPAKNSNVSSREVETKDMVKLPIYWIYFFVSVLFAGGGMIVLNHCSPILTESFAVTAAFAAIVVSMTSITNGVGRFLWGIVYDKIGVVKSLMVVAIIFVVSSTGMYISFLAGLTYVFIFFVCALMLSYAGNAIMMPANLRKMFGDQNYSMNYSIFGISSIFISTFPTIIGNVQVATGSYNLPLLFEVVVSIIALFVGVLVIKMYNNYIKES